MIHIRGFLIWLKIQKTHLYTCASYIINSQSFVKKCNGKNRSFGIRHFDEIRQQKIP